jgi:tRNA(adenine34) deaminase
MDDRLLQVAPNDGFFMELALAQAREAAGKGEVPVGAVVVCDGEVVGAGHNRRED